MASHLILQKKIAWFLLGTDLLGLLIAFNAVHLLGMQDADLHLLFSWQMIWVTGVILLVFYILDLYKPNVQVWGIGPFLRTPVAAAAAGGIIILIGYFTDNLLHGASPSVFGRLAFITSLILFALWAMACRYYFNQKVYETFNPKPWLVLGTGPSIQKLWKDYRVNGIRGSFIFLSDSPSANDADFVPQPEGSIEEIDRFIGRDLSGVIIGAEVQLTEAAKLQLMHQRLNGVLIYSIINFYEQFWQKIPVDHLQHSWFMMSSGFNLLYSSVGMRIKRLTDLFFSLAFLILTSPLLLLAVIAIRLDSQGPVLFMQERIGLNGSVFKLYKFRTMINGAAKGNKYTAENDHRITRVGRFLRKTRIDELPQLINVFKGEMSFIGPRAEWTRCVEDYDGTIPFYSLRHLVKPGITGWAQVNYPYGASVADALEKLQYDLYYIKNYSIWLDIRILLKTVQVVLFGKGR